MVYLATLKEIAKKVGTSITTVSRVLNHDTSLSVSDSLRKKVIETAQDLNYQTPRNRVSLPNMNKKRIGIIHWYDQDSELNDPYYVGIRRGIEKMASQLLVDLVVLYKEEGTFLLEKMGYVDGLICIGKFTSEQVQNFSLFASNLVFVDSSPDASQYDSIVIDFKDAITKVLEFVKKKGFKQLGYLGGVELVEEEVSLGERRARYVDFYAKKLGIYDERFFHIGEFTSTSGYQMMQEILKENTHAPIYFCANDSIAIGALKAIHEAGLRIPTDIGLIGFNDDTMTRFTFPSLTTVKVYTEFMGEQALYSLHEQFQGRSIPIRKMVPTEFIERDST